jgi:DNA polymerase III delta prime subunit
VKTLSKRLKIICDHENVRADPRALSLLCEKTDCDIRSCLNTLQFINSMAKATAKPNDKSPLVTLDLVRSMSMGQKDVHKSIYTVWEHIFKPETTSSWLPTSSKGLLTESHCMFLYFFTLVYLGALCEYVYICM